MHHHSLIASTVSFTGTMMKLCLALLLVAAVSCRQIQEQKYPTIPQPIPQQYPSPQQQQQQQYYVPQYQQQQQYVPQYQQQQQYVPQYQQQQQYVQYQQQQIPSYYPPQIARPDSLDHDQMCKLVLESSNKMLYYLFGMQINPIDFSFLQCMHKSELVEFQKLMDALKTLDMNFNALQIPGFGQFPRLPLLSCIGEQMFLETQAEVVKRPERDEDWPLPPSCGRYDGELNVQQCAVLMDRVIPTLVIPGIPQRTIPWTDCSFLDKMGDEELCYLRGAAAEQVQHTVEDTMLWEIIEIDPVQRLLPAFKCYLKYLVQNIDKKIESRVSDSESSEAYCESVTDLLVADVLDEVAGDRQAEQHERRSLDAEKRGYGNRRYRYCRAWHKSCNKYNNVKLRLKVKVGIKNQITNIGSSRNYNSIYNNVRVYTKT